MVDVHTHLQFHAFEKDYDEAIKRAFEKGVDKIINTGTSLESSLKAVELAEKYENLYAIVGIHPHHADKLEKGWDDQPLKIAGGSKKVVGVGEIGLDFYSYASNGIVDPKLQKEAFIRQIEIANQLSLPLQIHNRQAGADILKILNEHKDLIRKNPPGMFHCMSGDVDFLKKVLELGFYVGFDGNISYEGIAKGESTPLPDLVKAAPIERIVAETDAPYLPPMPHRGSRNEPSYVIIVAQFIAKIKGLEKKLVEDQTTQNAHKIFGI